jgi:Zn finger protein HypA/HybF involved in hydrogenase expression
MVEAYCVKCRTKVEIKNPHDVVLKNHRNAITGYCPICGSKVYRITGKDNHNSHHEESKEHNKFGSGIRMLK